MTTLKLILIVLPILEIAIFIWLLIRKDKKQIKQSVPNENEEVYCEDYERVFYNP